MRRIALNAVRQLPRDLLIAAVRGYRWFISPALASACRFEPSCSAYALGALQAHGAAAGTYLTLRRLVRCGPWCAGGCDPVPPHPPGLLRLLSGNASVRAAAASPRPTSSSRP